MSAGRPRVLLLTGGRLPRPESAVAGDIVLDAGWHGPLPSGVRRVPARDLLPAVEAERLLAACRELATTWHSGLVAKAPLRLAPGRVVETAALLELVQALKHLVLLRRLAELTGPCAIAADAGHPALGRIAPLLASDPVPVLLVPQGGTRNRLSRGVRAALGTWRSSRRSATPGTRPGAHAGRHGPAGSVRVWGLANYRNRPLLQALERDPRFSVQIFERTAENRYLQEQLPREGMARIGDEVLPARPTIRALVEVGAGALLRGIPGAGVLAADIIEAAMRRRIPSAEVEALCWARSLDADPPDLVVCGIPWDGDLKVLALVAAESGIPVVACQDGALAEAGAGGIPVGSAALAWGPRGRAWFAARGFPGNRVFEVGDPYLEALVRDVGTLDASELRKRLRVPAEAKVLLVGVQNSAPHLPATDPGDPMRLAAFAVEAAARASRWVVVLKAHPRLPLVDGSRRLRLVRDMAAAVPNARFAEPGEPVAGLMALADAHAGEGDTLGLEMLACGKPAFLLAQEGLPLPYPEFASTGAMPVLRTPGALASVLDGPTPVAVPSTSRALLAQHVCESTLAGDSLLALAAPPKPEAAS
jgi:hypothetical protein